uniref:Uncharacterized protein n=1 Tax=Oryza rufipogon TaxID=4529 RepID=A0A0E0R8P8_ORYRU
MSILREVAEALPSSAHLRRVTIIRRPPKKAVVTPPNRSVPKIAGVAEDRIYLVLRCRASLLCWFQPMHCDTINIYSTYAMPECHC